MTARHHKLSTRLGKSWILCGAELHQFGSPCVEFNFSYTIFRSGLNFVVAAENRLNCPNGAFCRELNNLDDDNGDATEKEWSKQTDHYVLYEANYDEMQLYFWHTPCLSYF